jgi:hypothetical protein
MRFSLVFAHDLATDAMDRIAPLARIASYGRLEVVGDADAQVAQLLASLAHRAICSVGCGLQARGCVRAARRSVTLVAGRDDVMLAGRVEIWSRRAASLVDTLNRPLREDASRSRAARRRAWFVTAAREVCRRHRPLRTQRGHRTHCRAARTARRGRRWAVRRC